MNLDLLKKLVLLANRNSNENEANSAARRVCKMLELSNFLLHQDPYIRKEDKIYGVVIMSDEDYEAAIDKEWDDVWKHVGRR